MDPVEHAKKRFPDAHQRIEEAFSWAQTLHNGQMRKTGEEYITHPVGALGFVLSFDHDALDADTAVATLLHDVVEDTPAILSDIEERFGADVRHIVDAVTDRKDGGTREDRDAAHIAQIREAAQQDPRVWLVRLADQLHNAQTLGVHRPERAREIAQLNLDVYVPVAESLGLDAAARELRTLSQDYLRT